MMSSLSPPNRRRRRIFITIAVLTLVVSATWWHWPRWDARFVGNWRAIESWDSRFRDSEFDFERGVVTITPYEQPPTLTILFRWSTAGGELSFRPGLARIDHVLSGPMTGWLYWIRDWFRVESTCVFRFGDNEDSVLLYREGEPIVLLQRIE